MTHIISVINLKGGVGKTHTTVALAETYSALLKKKVLVIDLDPQTNATTMLIGEDRWSTLNKNHHTLAQLFKDALNGDEYPVFDLNKTLQKHVSDVKHAKSVDLLPSSLDLIDVQDRLATVSSGKYYAVNPIEILSRAVKPIIEHYDIVLIDCPPNLGIITLNGLRMSNGYIIPTIPDVLSTYGIPQIVKRVKEFSTAIAEVIEPFGIVISKYREQSTVHKNETKRLRDENDARVFNTIVKEGNQIASAAEYQSDRTLIQKYGTNGLDAYGALAKEILKVLEG